MANAASMLEQKPVRLLIPGYPGAGKTSALAPLVDMGYKLRVLDYDNNNRPLLAFSDPSKLHNVDIAVLEDKMRRAADGTLVPNGVPTGYTEGMDLLDHWKYTDEEGTEVDLGRSAEWGHDHIVVLDTITSQGRCAMSKALSMNNRTVSNRRSQEWGLAQQLQLEFLRKLTSKKNKFHVIVMSHIKAVGPPETNKDDDDVMLKLKKQQANLIPTRLWPSAIGNALPPEIPGLFDTILVAERRIDAKGNVSRVLTLDVGPEIDVKVAARDFPSTLPLESGLRKLFEAQVPWSVRALQAANDNQPNVRSNVA
jgi:hypothetical protein